MQTRWRLPPLDGHRSEEAQEEVGRAAGKVKPLLSSGWGARFHSDLLPFGHYGKLDSSQVQVSKK